MLGFGLAMFLSAKMLLEQPLRTASIVTFRTVILSSLLWRRFLVERHILFMLKKICGATRVSVLFFRSYIKPLLKIRATESGDLLYVGNFRDFVYFQ